jgi:hypothetical protein
VYERVIKTTVFLRILCLLLLVGVVVQIFIPQKVYVDRDNITIRHLFTTRIDLKDLLGITERTSSKSGKRFYFIDTINGSYEVDDDLFTLKEGNQIIKQLGYSKIAVNEGNIKNVFCVPKFSIDSMRSITSESINYEFRQVKRVHSVEQIFFDAYISILISSVSLYLIIPSGYCCLYPERFKDIFSRWVSQKKPISLMSARVLSLWLFIVGLALLMFCNGIMFATWNK